MSERAENRPWAASKATWSRWLWRFLPAMGVLLGPWPGLAGHFSALFAACANPVARVAFGEGARIEFVPAHYAEQPWWVLLSVTNVFTGESFGVPVDTRTVAYVRLAVFLALAIAWPIAKTRRGLGVVAAGSGILLSVIAVTVAIPLLQILGKLQVLPLGVGAQSFLSVGILTLLTYPSMAFAIPALIYLAMLRVVNPAAARVMPHPATTP